MLVTVYVCGRGPLVTQKSVFTTVSSSFSRFRGSRQKDLGDKIAETNKRERGEGKG